MKNYLFAKKLAKLIQPRYFKLNYSALFISNYIEIITKITVKML